MGWLTLRYGPSRVAGLVRTVHHARAMSWDADVTIEVSDLDRAVHFYTQILDLGVRHRVDEDGSVVLNGAESTLRLRPSTGSTSRCRGAIVTGFPIDGSIEAAILRLAARGVVFRTAITGDGCGPIRLVFFADPDGHVLYLSESDSERAASAAS